MQRHRNAEQNREIDLDPYSTHILEELLQADGEWINTNQIIRLTLRAITDLMRVHGQSMKDMKSIMATRASKAQLTTGLSLKCSVSDITKTVDNISTSLDGKLSYQQMHTIIKDYATRQDLLQITLPSHENQQQQIQQLINQQIIMKGRMDEFQKQIIKKVTASATLAELQELMNIVEQKVSNPINQANINEINQALQNKVNKQYLNACLQKKVSKNQFESEINQKVDNCDLDYLVAGLQGKVSISTLEKLTQVIENKADKSDLMLVANERTNNHSRSQNKQWEDQVENLKNNLQEQIHQLKYNFETIMQSYKKQYLDVRENITEMKRNINFVEINLSKNINSVSSEINGEIWKVGTLAQGVKQQVAEWGDFQKTFTEAIGDLKNRKPSYDTIMGRIQDLNVKLHNCINSNLERREFVEFKSEIIDVLESKIESEDVQIALNKWETEINIKFAYDREQMMGLLNNVQKSLSDAISTNVNDIQIMMKNIAHKQDRYDLTLIEESLKKVRKEVEQCRKTVDMAYEQAHVKINAGEYESDLIEIKKRFDMQGRQLQQKANIKDVCVLTDSKPNIDDVNNALKELNNALESKIAEEDMQAILKDQAIINETLCSQNVVGRWFCKSGELRTGGLVPWEMECSNTVPDHFFWEKDKTSILILAAGIYELAACIFNQNAEISILINGEPIYQTYNNCENINTSNLQSNIRKNSKKKKEKAINGKKIQDFLILPARSRISVSCTGEAAEGFMNIRRL